MKIEFGFQANCSELVTHLGMTTIQEIAEAMRRIEEITGWKWHLQLDWRQVDEQKNDGEFRYVRLPAEDLESLLTFKNTDGNWTDIGIMRDIFEEISGVGIDLTGRYYQLFGSDGKEPIIHGDTIALVNTPTDDQQVWLDEDMGWPGIAYSCNGCQLKVFSIILWENQYVPALQAFHKIRKEYDTHLHGIGRYSTERYGLWLGFNYLPDELIVARMSA